MALVVVPAHAACLRRPPFAGARQQQLLLPPGDSVLSAVPNHPLCVAPLPRQQRAAVHTAQAASYTAALLCHATRLRLLQQRLQRWRLLLLPLPPLPPLAAPSLLAAATVQ